MPNHGSFKVAIVGLGKVGITAAYAILLKGLATELVLVSREEKKAAGEKADLEHGSPFYPRVTITATSKMEDLAGTDLVIFTAGCSQQPGQTRLDLTKGNCAIVDSMIPEIVRHAPDALILLVANPVDILTYRTSLIAKLPKGRVFGSGTLLDTARFRLHLSKPVDVNPTSIHAYILGEHGDSSFATVSTATIGGKPLANFNTMSPEHIKWATEETRKDAYTVISEKGATYYGIATTLTHIVGAIAHDEKKIMPLSIPLSGEYGIEGVSLSLPCILGRSGIQEVVDIPLSTDEKDALLNSAKTLKSYLDET